MTGLSHLPEDLLQELMVTFNVEARERLEAANRQLLALESSSDPDADAELVAEIFREVHSLKGAAAAVGLPEIRDVSHSLETLFERARSGEVLNPDVFDVVYQALDTIGTLIDGGPAAGADSDIADLLKDLDEAAATGFETPAPPTPAPAKGGEIDNSDVVRATARADRSSEDPSDASGGPVFDSPPGGGSSPATGAAPRSEETIRVTTAKLDSLMAQVGELLVASIGAQQRSAEVAELLDMLNEAETQWRETRPRYRKLISHLSDQGNGAVVESLGTRADEINHLLDFLQQSDVREQMAAKQLAEFRRKLAIDSRRMAQIVSDLQDEVRRTRMLPASTIFASFPRVVRDVARSVGKEAQLVVKGGDIEVDRAVLEQIKDPLVHLLRNAVDHGLEIPDRRELNGKPPTGTITIEAAQRGDSLALRVSDDGAGIDLDKVRKTAVKRGFASEEDVEVMPDREVLDFIFRSGVSTSQMITDVSGRGVGLDVVREGVERMHGIIDIENRPGLGTTFLLTVPLAVATTHCLLVRCASMTFALPITSVARILRIHREEVGRTEGRETIRLDDRPVPLGQLGEMLGIDSRQRGEHRERFPAVILGAAEKRTALVVDELLGAQEIVIKSLPAPLQRVRNISGATIMPNGEVVLILNASDLSRAAERGTPFRTVAAPEPAETVASARSVVLVADDSIVTRALEKNILESGGFTVRVAADGIEAWNALQTEDIDLVVADVEMPRLDGFDLTEKIRADARLRDLPVVLVTSLDSRDHKERGVSVGADAHIVKQSFNQEVLLNTIRRLI